jgi:hypothetical protein
VNRAGAFRLVAAVALVSLASAASPFFFLYYRDNFSTHFPIKAISAEAFRSGAIPFWNFHAGGGQPLAGNPNTLSFYPDNLLYLLLPTPAAFNLHFLIHLLCAWFIMRALVRRKGCGHRAAAAAATIYAFSGVAVSTTVFYNLVTAIALVPLAMLTLENLLVRRDWRSGLLVGASWGLLGLAGEPVTVIGTALLSLTLVTFNRPADWRPEAGRVARHLLLAAAAAIIIASPSLIAFSEIAPDIERSAQRYSADTVLAASLPLWRLPEMIVGPYYGRLTDLSAAGFLANRPPTKWPPLFPALMIGAILLPALLDRGRRGSSAYRIGFLLFVFLALGRFNPLVAAVVEQFDWIRIFRYPEKFVIHATVCAAVLIGIWIEKEESPLRSRVGLFLAVAIAAGTAAWAGMAAGLDPLVFIRAISGLILAIALAAFAWTRRYPVLGRFPLLFAVLPVVFWGLLTIPIDRLAPYVHAAGEIPDTARDLRIFRLMDEPSIRTFQQSSRSQYRARAESLDPLFGATAGLRYALDRSPDGLYSIFTRIVSERVSATPLETKLIYARIAGCTFVGSRERLLSPQLDLAAARGEYGNPFYIYILRAPRPHLFVPDGLIPVTTINEAVAIVESGRLDPLSESIVPARLASQPSGAATAVSVATGIDSLTLDISSPEGTIVVVNESWFRGWKASAAGRRLDTFPADIDRLGIVVPAGDQRIELVFGQHRHLVHGALLVSTFLLGLAAFLAIRRSSQRIADPAR